MFSVPPPCVPYTPQVLSALLAQLPPPTLIVGDLNLHDPLWDSSDPPSTASAFLPLLAQFKLTCLNTGVPTFERFNPPCSSSLDLSFCSISHLPSYSWTRLPNLSGSDHYPILIQTLLPSTLPPLTTHWNYSRADWAAFTQATILPTPPFSSPSLSIDMDYSLFSSTLLQTAPDHIPLLPPPPTHPQLSMLTNNVFTPCTNGPPLHTIS